MGTALVFAALLTQASSWIGVDAPIPPRDGSARSTACFVKTFVNPKAISKAAWVVSGLGAYEARINGRVPYGDVLEPGFTHLTKRRQAFVHDVTAYCNAAPGATNVLSAMVSTGWWSDEIVDNPFGPKERPSAFRAELNLTYTDGTEETVPTDLSWKAAYGGPVVNATIYWGETYDARVSCDWQKTGAAEWPAARRVDAFHGEISDGAPARVWPRRDLVLAPVDACVWRGVTGADDTRYGRVRVLRRYAAGEVMELAPGETLVVDFGQNAAGNPEFVAAAPEGTVLTGHPAEMLNDRMGEKSRRNDGPGGSAYIENYRLARTTLTYIFGGRGTETYHPRHTFYGGRYFSFTATAPVRFERIEFVPYSSLRREDETGFISTGSESLNRLIANCVWGMRANYLSVPTDCPQRDERQGWSGDTQAFFGAAVYAADVAGFLGKWLLDMRDCQLGDYRGEQRFSGAFRNCAPLGACGFRGHMFGWGDAGVSVPYGLWVQYASLDVVKAHYPAMKRFMALILRTKYATSRGERQCCDWLSDEKLETWRMMYGLQRGGEGPRPGETVEDMHRLWDFYALCYIADNLRMMAAMATAIGESGDAAFYAAREQETRANFAAKFLDADGNVEELFRDMQSPTAVALVRGMFPDSASAARAGERLVANLKAEDFRIRTGFLGTAVLLDALSDVAGSPETAYSVLLQRKYPGWLYSVDQGATTIWERWTSYTKERGFGPAAMNSFNHYAYGAVLGWVFRTMAGIRPDPGVPGFGRFVLAPRPDPRVGSVEARYRSRAGVIESSWRYDGNGICHWKFTVPAGAEAELRLPDGTVERVAAGRHEMVLK
jgi:alpha-L-rhamnosidase